VTKNRNFAKIFLKKIEKSMINVRNIIKNIIEIPQVYLNPFYHSDGFLQEKICRANYGFCSFELTSKAKCFQNSKLKIISEFCARIIDSISKIFSAPFYNFGVFVYNNLYVKLKNRSIEKHNQTLRAIEAKKWNKTALWTWVNISSIFFASVSFGGYLAVYKIAPMTQIKVIIPSTFYSVSMLVMTLVGLVGVVFGMQEPCDASYSFADRKKDFLRCFPSWNRIKILSNDPIFTLSKKNEIDDLENILRIKNPSVVKIFCEKNDKDRKNSIEAFASYLKRKNIPFVCDFEADEYMGRNEFYTFKRVDEKWFS
jgi:hypothetical protein